MLFLFVKELGVDVQRKSGDSGNSDSAEVKSGPGGMRIGGKDLNP